ncbi:MAG: hypothetical protein AB1700_08820 [Bacillota bacterium]
MVCGKDGDFVGAIDVDPANSLCRHLWIWYNMAGVITMNNAKKILDQIERLPLREQQLIAAALARKLKYVPPHDEAWNAAVEEIIERYKESWEELARR